MNVETGMLKPGEARHPAESTQEIIAQDNVKAPEWAASEHYEYLGSEDISKDRYIDPEFARGEFEKMWTRTWQMACREDHIPEAGDYYVYDIGQYSFIVTRCKTATSAPTSTRASIAAPSSSPRARRVLPTTSSALSTAGPGTSTVR